MFHPSAPSSRGVPRGKRSFLFTAATALSSLSYISTVVRAGEGPEESDGTPAGQCPSAKWALTDINNATFAEGEKYSCKAFQVTAKCDPFNGRPEKRLSCTDTVDPGASGYCICKRESDGSTHNVRHENCNHVKFRCEDTCKR